MRITTLLLLLLSPAAAFAAADQASFRDCKACPEMVPLPTGEFLMGEPRPTGDQSLKGWGGPPVRISITRPFAIAKTEITNAQFRAFVTDTHYEIRNPCRSIWDNGKPSWREPLWPDSHPRPDAHPVVCVGFEDALSYVHWLNEKASGRRTYDLPSEAQFEYAARAGDENATAWATGTPACDMANVADRRFAKTNQTVRSIDCDDGFASTSPVASFPPNAFGLYDMVGNVWEWTLDCSSDDYITLPRDGSARLAARLPCTGRQTRGGSFVSATGPWLRYSTRGGLHPVPGTNHVALGFRVVAYDTP